VDELMGRWMSRQWMAGQMGGWIDDRRMGGCLNETMDIWIKGWRMDG
jgi:hypothetical protein